MEAKIVSLIEDIERSHNIKVIFAVEGGSRAWNYHSNGSDFDVRFVYKHNDTTKYYNKEGELLSQPILRKDRSIVILDHENKCDFQGWDVAKTVNHAQESNNALIEWLVSPVVYVNHGFDRLKSAFFKYFDENRPEPNLLKHHFKFARRNFKTFEDFVEGQSVSVKPFVCTLKSLLAYLWITKYKTYKLKLDLYEMIRDLKRCDALTTSIADEIIESIEIKKRNQTFFVPSQKLFTWISNHLNLPRKDSSSDSDESLNSSNDETVNSGNDWVINTIRELISQH